MNKATNFEKVISYIRTWQDNIGEKTEEFQRAAIFVYCEKHKLEIETDCGDVTTLKDDSAFTPAFDHILHRAERGDRRKVIVSDYKVLGIDPIDVNLRLKKMAEAGVEIVSVMDDVNKDPNDPMMLKLIVHLTKALIEENRENFDATESFIAQYYKKYPWGSALNGGRAV